MKAINQRIVLSMVACVAIGSLQAAHSDGVGMKDGKMMTVKHDNKSVMIDDAVLKDGTKVMKDGGVVSPDGTKWNLKDGEMLDWDGKLSVHFLKDGIVCKDGKVWQIKGGEKSEVTTELVLADGTKIMADGKVSSKEGKNWELEDGDLIMADGRPVLDGAVIGWGGRPLITSDCAGTPLEREKSFPNGNKVMTDGGIAFADGKTGKLGDGDVLQKDGTYLPALK